MHVTVAVCTWNRARLLDQTLAGLQELVIPPGVEWEVLVVNNNCSDDTDVVIDRHAARLPLRGVHEPKQGIANARNAAVRAARGDMIFWTDDDVLVDPQWLSEYCAAVRQWPEVVFFGGPIAPWFETPPPAWMVANWPRVRDMFGEWRFTESAKEIDIQSLPFGSNYAVRTDVQSGYRYDSNLGHIGDTPRFGEETAVLRQMFLDGHRGRIIPSARVRHFIPQHRLTLDYVCRWYFALGQWHQTELARKAPNLGIFLRTLLKTWFRLNVGYARASHWILRRLAGEEHLVWPATEASYFLGRLARHTTTKNDA